MSNVLRILFIIVLGFLPFALFQNCSSGLNSATSNGESVPAGPSTDFDTGSNTGSSSGTNRPPSSTESEGTLCQNFKLIVTGDVGHADDPSTTYPVYWVIDDNQMTPNRLPLGSGATVNGAHGAKSVAVSPSGQLVFAGVGLYRSAAISGEIIGTVWTPSAATKVYFPAPSLDPNFESFNRPASPFQDVTFIGENWAVPVSVPTMMKNPNRTGFSHLPTTPIKPGVVVGGQLRVLASDSDRASALALTSHGDDLVVVGVDGSDYSYWTNDSQKYTLSLPNGRRVGSGRKILVDLNDDNLLVATSGIIKGVGEVGDVYAAMYWLNDVPVTLAERDGKSPILNGAVLNGTDIYLAGYFGNGGSSSIAVLWKNDSSRDLETGCTASAVTVMNGNEYVAGTCYNGGLRTAVLWNPDGEKVLLPAPEDENGNTNLSTSSFDLTYSCH